MFRDIIEIILVTLLPFLELRASIPYGILKLGMSWPEVFVIAVISNMLLGVIIFFLLDKCIHIVLYIKPLAKFYHYYVERMQKKIHGKVEKYGEYAVAAFVAVPLPGSGSYSGALAAYLLGMSYKDFIKANAIGVVIAGILVTLIVTAGVEGFSFMVKMI